MEPLFDLDHRIVAIGTGASTSAIVDRLLRLHAAKQRSRRITLYVVGTTAEMPPLSAGDALLLADVLRSIAPPIRTVGFGLLTGWQPVLLACGTRGERYMLTHSLVAAGPLDWTGLTLPKNSIGLQSPAHPTTLIRQQLDRQVQALFTELKLVPDLFARHHLLTAQEAIANGLTDHVVERQLTLRLDHPHSRAGQKTVEIPPHETLL